MEAGLMFYQFSIVEKFVLFEMQNIQCKQQNFEYVIRIVLRVFKVLG
jgi:hypothetical protein